MIAEIAARLGRDAGVGSAAGHLFLPLMRRTLAIYSDGGGAALTGPIRRGDTGTVARHLEVLAGPERSAYITLGREALRLAIASGLDASSAAAIERLLY